MRTALLSLLIASGLLAQGSRPSVSNGQMTTDAFKGDLNRQISGTSPAWFGYAIKTKKANHFQSCGWDRGAVVGSPVRLEGTDEVAVLFRVESGSVQKIRVYSMDCAFDAGGLPLHWIENVPAAASLAYLKPQMQNEAAMVAIAQHDTPEATNVLLDAAKSNSSGHVRGQALFWLSQRAGDRAAAAIVNAIENDPDTQVKEKAVFALSQLPKDEGIPKLIQVASNQRNAQVQKKAFFWLGQSQDPRALAFIEKVLLN